MNDRPRWVPHSTYPILMDDWLGSVELRDRGPAATGTLLLMCMAAAKRECCSLPDDIDRIARMTGCSADEIGLVLDLWERSDGRLIHPKCLTVRQYQDSTRSRAERAAAARWNGTQNAKQHAKPDAKQHAKQMPPNPSLSLNLNLRQGGAFKAPLPTAVKRYREVCVPAGFSDVARVSKRRESRWRTIMGDPDSAQHWSGAFDAAAASLRRFIATHGETPSWATFDHVLRPANWDRYLEQAMLDHEHGAETHEESNAAPWRHVLTKLRAVAPTFPETLAIEAYNAFPGRLVKLAEECRTPEDLRERFKVAFPDMWPTGGAR